MRGKTIDKRIKTILTHCKNYSIKSNSIDLIVTDPPYNLGKDYGNNFLSKEEYRIYKAMAKSMDRVLMDQYMFLWAYNLSPIYISF